MQMIFRASLIAGGEVPGQPPWAGKAILSVSKATPEACLKCVSTTEECSN